MAFKDLYTADYEYQQDKVKMTTLKTYKDRIKYIQLIDLNVAHYELWRKELSKVDIKNSTKNDI